jgi:hypothetical protein
MRLGSLEGTSAPVVPVIDSTARHGNRRVVLDARVDGIVRFLESWGEPWKRWELVPAAVFDMGDQFER